MKISVIGCGRWGAFIAWYLNSLKRHEVTLYGRESSERFKRIKETRSNDLLTFDERMLFTSDLQKACEAETIVISVSSQSMRALAREIASLPISDKTFVLCMKGIEIGTGKRLSEVMKEETDGKIKNCSIAVWLGPGHVQDYSNRIPGCMVIDSYDYNTKYRLVNEFSSDLIRFYYGNDMIGNEIGAALKNVIGIAAGMLDGMGISALKGALTTRGAYEVSNLICALGGKAASAYGLCHLGDYSATVFSQYSNNRMFGEAFIKKEQFEKLAEGYYTVKAVVMLADKYNVQMPISRAVYDVLYNGADPKEAIRLLMTRDLKEENKARNNL